MMSLASPLQRLYVLLAITSLFLLMSMKGTLIEWLSDLPDHELGNTLAEALRAIPDLGLSRLFEETRQRFLDWLRT